MRLVAVAIALLAVGLSGVADAAARSGRPNILLIVADDLGYADLGVFGGDIDTPNIDALARSGVLFTRFHTAPVCSPTRAMLMSGNNNHVAGVANQNRDGLVGVPVTGYEGGLSDRIAPLPSLLRDAGYHTYMSGKWHLGLREPQWPIRAGFDHSFAILQGGGSYYDERSYRPGGSTFVEDEHAVAYPTGIYATELYTDKLISFIEQDKESSKPFFAYAAYTSPHWPLQVPAEYRDLYAGRYDAGYDALRIQRLESLKRAGIIASDVELPPRNPTITPWGDLSPDQQKAESRKMELYAALVDNLDDHIGRLLEYLKQNDLYDNTLIVFMSDNGAAPEDFYNGPFFPQFMPHTRKTFDNSYEKMGTADSFVSYGPQWAEAGSAPFSRHKQFMLEGGIVAPMFVTGAHVSRSGEIRSDYVTAMDIAPTLLEIAGAKYPDDGSVVPMLGESMVGFLSASTELIHDENYVTVQSHRGHAMVRKGPWKLVAADGPFDESKFALFDVVADPGETKDLAQDHPEIFDDLVRIWREKRREYGIILPQDL